MTILLLHAGLRITWPWSEPDCRWKYGLLLLGAALLGGLCAAPLLAHGYAGLLGLLLVLLALTAYGSLA